MRSSLEILEEWDVSELINPKIWDYQTDAWRDETIAS